MGQQRLATFSIIILAVINCLKTAETHSGEKEEKNKRRPSQLLHERHISLQDIETGEYNPILTLNKTDNDFYQYNLVELSPASPPAVPEKPSEKLLKRAFDWFTTNIKAKYMDEKGLIRFIETILDKMSFTIIYISDEQDAYTIFETLNARGVELASTDLLKNFLFAKVSRLGNGKRLEAMERRWNKLNEELGTEKIIDFIRTYWNSQYPLARKAKLFKDIRPHIKNHTVAFDLVRELNNNAAILQRPKTISSWIMGTISKPIF